MIEKEKQQRTAYYLRECLGLTRERLAQQIGVFERELYNLEFDKIPDSRRKVELLARIEQLIKGSETLLLYRFLLTQFSEN